LIVYIGIPSFFWPFPLFAVLYVHASLLFWDIIQRTDWMELVEIRVHIVAHHLENLVYIEGS